LLFKNALNYSLPVVDENICTFQVPVEQILGMAMLKRKQKLFEKGRNLVLREFYHSGFEQPVLKIVIRIKI
jgi:hypothetical protein